MTDKTPSGLPQPQTVANLMRAIDAYAYDYKEEGKFATSRKTVERELRAALSAPAVETVAVQEAADYNEEQTQPFYDLAWKHGAHRHTSFEGDELLAISFTPKQFDAFCVAVSSPEAKEPRAYVDGNDACCDLRAALEDVAAMTYDPWSNGARAKEIAESALSQQAATQAEANPCEYFRPAAPHGLKCESCGKDQRNHATAPTGAQAEPPKFRGWMHAEECKCAKCAADDAEQAAPKAEPSILREVTDALRESIDFKSDIKVADLIRRAETVLAGHQRGEA
jgi:hypothetical protein